VKASLGLVRYDAMCNAIAVCHDVDEVKEIRAKARALEVYAKQALNTDAERKCGQIRLRAERRAGELLKEMKQNGQRQKAGDNAGAHRGSPRRSSNGATTLRDLGLTCDQSSKWQQLADIPEKEFETELAKPGPKPTTEGMVAGRKPRAAEPQIDVNALQAWGRIKDFERCELLDQAPKTLLKAMTDPMRDDIVRIVPPLIRWLQKFRPECHICGHGSREGEDEPIEAMIDINED